MERINIIGAGLAGLSAAVTLAEKGFQSTLISLHPSERAQSVMAEGGINGASNTMGENDSPAEHVADTLRAGADLADPEAVRDLTEQAPEIHQWLMRLGTPLHRKDSRLILRNFGGQKKKRTAYAQSSTGKVLMTALIDECRRHEASGMVRRLDHHEFLSLVLRDGCCGGVGIRDSYTGDSLALSGPVIFAAGGLNGFFPGMTTGTTANSGDAAAILFSQGTAFANLEFIQYHPTTVQIPGKRLLISEAARGEGGRLFVTRKGSPWYFMEEKYPELGNLMPRDVVSREMFCVSRETGGQVYLDLRPISKNTWKEKLSDLREEIQYYLAIDPARQPVPVSPGIHYFMGGIHIDRSHHTNYSGLYAAGECACQYHGANRLGGNSTLGAIYGGMVAANTAAAGHHTDNPEALEWKGPQPPAGSPVQARKLCEILCGGLGILRDEDGLNRALKRLEELPESENPTDEMRRMLAKAMLLSARERRESRGAHNRTDHPQRDDEHFRKTSVVTLQNGKIGLQYQAVGKDETND